jgi:hypothetical protein
MKERIVPNYFNSLLTQPMKTTQQIMKIKDHLQVFIDDANYNLYHSFYDLFIWNHFLLILIYLSLQFLYCKPDEYIRAATLFFETLQKYKPYFLVDLCVITFLYYTSIKTYRSEAQEGTKTKKNIFELLFYSFFLYVILFEEPFDLLEERYIYIRKHHFQPMWNNRKTKPKQEDLYKYIQIFFQKVIRDNQSKICLPREKHGFYRHQIIKCIRMLFQLQQSNLKEDVVSFKRKRQQWIQGHRKKR